MSKIGASGVFVVWAALGVGCGGGTSVPANATFKGVLAGSDASTSLSGSVLIALDHGNMTAAMQLFGTEVPLEGTVSGASYQLSGDGWVLQGNFKSSTLTVGTLTGPNDASGSYTAEDETDGNVDLYCGTFSGDGAGTWNFAVAADGTLSGVFSGDADGKLTGSLVGGSLMIQWSGTSFVGGNVSGTATGAVAGTSVSGQWQGSGLSGTFASDQSCGEQTPSMTGTAPPDCTPTPETVGYMKLDGTTSTGGCCSGQMNAGTACCNGTGGWCTINTDCCVGTCQNVDTGGGAIQSLCQ